MIIKNGTVFINGEFKQTDIQVADGTIQKLEALHSDLETIDASGCYVFPGFIDIHVHGANQHAVGESVEATQAICKFFPQFGVTSFVPTPIAGKDSQKTGEQVNHIRRAMGSEGADILGIFLYTDYKNRSIAYYDPPHEVTKEHTLSMAGGTLDHILMLSIAPELPNGLEHVHWLTAHGVTPVIAFSEGSGDDIKKAVAAGATLTDHFPNGFPVIDHHFDMGTTQCLLEDDLYMQINCDCIHVAPNYIQMMLRLKGEDKLVAVSDSSVLLGCPEGQYFILGKDVFLKNGAVRDINGKLVTGAHSFDENMRTMQKNGFPLETIGKIFTENAANALRLNDRGKIEIGRRADFVIMDKDLNVLKTIIHGKVVYTR